MRWTAQSWRWTADDMSGHTGTPRRDLPWIDDAATRCVARLDLAYRLADVAVNAVPPLVFVALDGTIDCHWFTSRRAPEPFQPVDEQRWVLPADIELSQLATAARYGELRVHLVTHVGVTPDHRLILADLDHWVSLGVQASPAEAIPVVRALGGGVGAPPLAPQPTQWWGGLEPPPTHAGRPHVERCDDAESAVEACWLTAAVPAVAVIHGWIPQQLPLPGSGRAVITTGPAPGGLRLSIRQGQWWLDPLHVAVIPVGIEPRVVPDFPGETQTKEQYMTTSAESAVSVHRLTPAPAVARRHLRLSERSAPLMVSVLGSPRVVDQHGEPVTFERSKALELVVWLAVHRPRCTRSGARHALWDLPIRDGTFANIVCDARRRLADAVTAPAGTEWIGRGVGDELPLHPHVITDADFLRTVLRSVHGNPDPLGTQHLSEALHLARGVPFEGTSYLWADAEGLTSELTMLIVQASAALARRHLDAGDVDGVFDATSVGLRVVPRHEELVAARLRAHHRNGDDAGVRQEWESYERALALDAFSSRPSTKLLALRHELLHRPVSA
jgi:hypothetical protein